jgi:membrane protease YdiL (CAAX protease family)
MKRIARALAALTLLFAVHHAFVYFMVSTDLYRLQRRLLGWPFLQQAVFFFAVPILALALLRREPSEYGLRWNRHVAAAGATILGLTLALPIAVDGVCGQLTPVDGGGYLLSTLVFQVLFSGIGEELSFRGFYQGEINRAAGRPLAIGHTRFGPGLLVGALFFGLGHLGITDAWRGAPVDFVAFAKSGAIGLLLGFAKEFVGSVFLVGFLHASIDTYASLVQPSIPGRVTHFVALGTVFFLLFARRIHAGDPCTEPSTRANAEGRGR